MSRLLLEAAGVGVVPGMAFGQEGFIRLSYATSEDRIREGLTRMSAVLAEME
jgi:aspartate aminotransferase